MTTSNFAIMMHQESSAGDPVWTRNGAGGTDRTDDNYNRYTLLLSKDDTLYIGILEGPNGFSSFEKVDMSQSTYIQAAQPDQQIWIVNWREWGYSALNDYHKVTLAHPFATEITRHFGLPYSALWEQHKADQLQEASTVRLSAVHRFMNRRATPEAVKAYCGSVADIRNNLTSYLRECKTYFCAEAESVLQERANKLARFMIATAVADPENFTRILLDYEKENHEN